MSRRIPDTAVGTYDNQLLLITGSPCFDHRKVFVRTARKSVGLGYDNSVVTVYLRSRFADPFLSMGSVPRRDDSALKVGGSIDVLSALIYTPFLSSLVLRFDGEFDFFAGSRLSALPSCDNEP